jgi:hypothetical protein
MVNNGWSKIPTTSFNQSQGELIEILCFWFFGSILTKNLYFCKLLSHIKQSTNVNTYFNELYKIIAMAVYEPGENGRNIQAKQSKDLAQ